MIQKVALEHNGVKMKEEDKMQPMVWYLKSTNIGFSGMVAVAKLSYNALKFKHGYFLLAYCVVS